MGLRIAACYWLVFIISVFLSGCLQIKSSQLQGIKSLITKPDDPLSEYEWLLQWGDYQKNVFAVNFNQVHVFGNVFGDGITLENMRLREAEGLGKFNHVWQFIQRDGRIMAYESGQLRGTFTCNNWRLVGRNPLTRIEQECIESRGLVALNIIELDQNGSVKHLTYSLFINRPPLVLTKL